MSVSYDALSSLSVDHFYFSHQLFRRIFFEKGNYWFILPAAKCLPSWLFGHGWMFIIYCYCCLNWLLLCTCVLSKGILGLKGATTGTSLWCGSGSCWVSPTLRLSWRWLETGSGCFLRRPELRFTCILLRGFIMSWLRFFLSIISLFLYSFISLSLILQ